MNEKDMTNHLAASDLLDDKDGAPNLDAQTPEVLMAFWAIVATNPVRSARRLFKARQPGYTKVMRYLGHYASNKATAMQCRVRGDIQAAQVYEDICERIYKDLPDFARW